MSILDDLRDIAAALDVENDVAAPVGWIDLLFVREGLLLKGRRDLHGCRQTATSHQLISWLELEVDAGLSEVKRRIVFMRASLADVR